MRIALIFFAALCLVRPVFAASIDYRTAPKFALVIGNTNYDGALKLRNAGNDARLLGAKLQDAGYTTELLFNTDRKTMYEAIGRLADHLNKGGVGVFYYAGHGVEIKERNYLIPVSVSLKEINIITQQSIPMDYLIQRLKESGAHLSVILLDACRNDPSTLRFEKTYRGIAPTGFVPEKPANGMLIAYATQPGERALDGEGHNGPFALALANWMTKPGMILEDAIKHVMTDVRATTKDEQRPWMATSLVGHFVLVPAPNQHIELTAAKSEQHLDASLTRSQPSTPANEAKPALSQWFELLNNDEQMKLTADINRQAASLNQDDLPKLTQQARGGSVVAQSVLGLAYRQGFGVGMKQVRSNQQAIKWLLLAADQHLPFALNELGEMYYLGQGVPKNSSKARTYFEAAIAQHYTPAKLNLFQLLSESSQMDAATMAEMLKNTLH
ncbi:caspase family protein [Undibacterium sp. RuRC25W]|uniref:caspase family protein n=1 Tax=Undibacterium sp. RuRC25W TaxID=3413047 RepID=UPI003BEFB9B3